MQVKKNNTWNINVFIKKTITTSTYYPFSLQCTDTERDKNTRQFCTNTFCITVCFFPLAFVINAQSNSMYAVSIWKTKQNTTKIKQQSRIKGQNMNYGTCMIFFIVISYDKKYQLNIQYTACFVHMSGKKVLLQAIFRNYDLKRPCLATLDTKLSKIPFVWFAKKPLYVKPYQWFFDNKQLL